MNAANVHDESSSIKVYSSLPLRLTLGNGILDHEGSVAADEGSNKYLNKDLWVDFKIQTVATVTICESLKVYGTTVMTTVGTPLSNLERNIIL